MAIVSTEQTADEASTQDIMDALARDARIDVKTIGVDNLMTIELE